MRLFDWLVKKHVEEEFPKALQKTLDEKLPEMIERILIEGFEKDPNRQLTKAGFGWALSVALRKRWPDVERFEASRWLWDYMSVPFGAQGYLWNYTGADEIARQYVADFGER